MSNNFYQNLELDDVDIALSETSDPRFEPIAIKGRGFEGAKEGLTQALDLATDVAPFIGSAKALTELPEDAQFAYQLLEEGYDEGSIKKMGLGAGFGLLTAAGFLPGAKIATDLGQRAIKEGVKETAGDVVEQTRAAFRADPASMDSVRKQRLVRMSKGLPSGERRQFIQESLRPTPRVYHGAPTLGDTDVKLKENNQIINDLKENRESIRNEQLKKVSDTLGEGPDKDLVDADKLFDFIRQENPIQTPVVFMMNGKKYVGSEAIMAGERYSKTFDATATSTRPARTQNYQRIKFIDEDGKQTNEMTVRVSDDNKISLKDLTKILDDQESMSRSKTDTFYTSPGDMAERATSRADELAEEGTFQPYRDEDMGGFAGAEGMTSSDASGRHAELKEKAISLSRDPLVSLKEVFGDRRLDNIMVSRLPKSMVRNLNPADYDRIETGEARLSDILTRQNLETLNERERKQLEDAIGISIPKSIHLEAEIASKNPEQLDVERLSDVLDDRVRDFYSVGDTNRRKNIGKLPLKDRVREGQKLANTVRYTGYFIQGIASSPAKAATKMTSKIGEEFTKFSDGKIFEDLSPAKQYSLVRQYFKDMQSLGQYTEQYGARGTYDTFLTEAAKDRTNLETLAFNLPEGSEKKETMKAIVSVLENIRNIRKLGSIAKTMDTTFPSRSPVAELGDRELLSGINARVKYQDKLKRYERMAALGLADRSAKPSMKGVFPITYNDAKRAMFLLTQKLNRGGLMAKKFANGGDTFKIYEDKIIADEIRRKMNVLMDEVALRNLENQDDPIKVVSNYFKEGSAQKRYQDAMAKQYGREPITGKFYAYDDGKRREINVPKTPTLVNLLAMAEEVAHLDKNKPGMPKTRKNPYEEFEDKKYLDLFAEKETGVDNSSIMGGDFDPYETFNLEGDYLEEMRAKQKAFETVFGGLAERQIANTNVGKFHTATKASYQQNFADYINSFASPVVKAAFFNKYPDLKQVYRETPVSDELKEAARKESDEEMIRLKKRLRN